MEPITAFVNGLVNFKIIHTPICAKFLIRLIAVRPNSTENKEILREDNQISLKSKYYLFLEH